MTYNDFEMACNFKPQADMNIGRGFKVANGSKAYNVIYI